MGLPYRFVVTAHTHVFTRKNRADPDATNPRSAEIYVINLDGTGLTCLTCPPPGTVQPAQEERSPAWSPDGERIVYSCRKGTRGGNTLEICVMNADGTNVVTLTDNALATCRHTGRPMARSCSRGRSHRRRPGKDSRPG